VRDIAAPAGRYDDSRGSIRAADERYGYSKRVFRRCGNLSESGQHRRGIGPGEQDLSRKDLRDRVKADGHSGHDAKIAPAASQRPEQFGILRITSRHASSVGEYDLRGKQVV